MEPLLQFLLLLALIVAAAKAAGYISTLLGQPAVLGELLIGLILGPTVIDMLHWPFLDSELMIEIVAIVAHLGVIFLMFIAGLEADLESMRKVGRPALFVGVLGVIAPILLGLGTGLLFGFSVEGGLFLGLVLAATSVSISAQTLLELKVLRTPVGIGLLSAAVVDDVLVIFLLSLFVSLTGGGSEGAIGMVWVVLRIIIFLAASIGLGLLLLPRLTAQIERLPISQGVTAFVIVVTLLFAWAAEELGGMAAITGAFIAGLMFGRTAVRERIERSMSIISYSFLVPVFFVSIGLEANARDIGIAGIPFALLLIAVAIISKLIGGGGGAKLAGLSNRDSLRMGVGMISRGEVGLIVATIGLGAGLITQGLFANVVVMVLITTLVTPLLLRKLYPKPAEPPRTPLVRGS